MLAIRHILMYSQELMLLRSLPLSYFILISWLPDETPAVVAGFKPGNLDAEFATAHVFGLRGG
jgi:hypothetical protein